MGYSYDVMGRVSNMTSPQGSVSYTYNADGLATSMSATGYPSVTYGYNLLDQLTSVTQNNQIYTYQYDAVGRRINLSRPNGVNTYYYYDDADRLTALIHKKMAARRKTMSMATITMAISRNTAATCTAHPTKWCVTTATTHSTVSRM